MLALAAPFRLDTAFLDGLLQALGRRREAMRRRVAERDATVRTDRDVLAIFDELVRSGEITLV
jgi:hypothetical protein